MRSTDVLTDTTSPFSVNHYLCTYEPGALKQRPAVVFSDFSILSSTRRGGKESKREAVRYSKRLSSFSRIKRREDRVGNSFTIASIPMQETKLLVYGWLPGLRTWLRPNTKKGLEQATHADAPDMFNEERLTSLVNGTSRPPARPGCAKRAGSVYWFIILYPSHLFRSFSSSLSALVFSRPAIASNSPSIVFSSFVSSLLLIPQSLVFIFLISQEIEDTVAILCRRILLPTRRISKKMKAILLPLALFASAAVAQTSSVCGADYIVEACLGSENAKLAGCGDSDWGCKCQAYTDILT